MRGRPIGSGLGGPPVHSYSLVAQLVRGQRLEEPAVNWGQLSLLLAVTTQSSQPVKVSGLSLRVNPEREPMVDH